ncbi:murein transglycosylase A [Methylobacterium sp. Leaf99]|uniref:murein transglycosylase A n=1 Tax=Methylobacterium sp. Leaf99 TaxID=1736251 RepID=UPI003FD05F20
MIGAAVAALAFCALPGSAAPAAEPSRLAGAASGEATLEAVDLAGLPGFPGPDPAVALDAFRRTCAAPPVAMAPAVTGSAADLAAACAGAAAVPADGAAAFFATAFTAHRIVRPAADGVPERRTGFLTGYFEPELAGSPGPAPGFAAPVLARPGDLVSLEPGETRPGLDPVLRAGRRTETGLVPYPDRAAIEDGALGDAAVPLLWLHPVDLFVLQVQGSGRVRLTDGRVVRVLYDGRNGRPYTAIGKLIVGEGHLPLDGLTLARWTGWLRDNPETARRLMRRNQSYIFFKLAPIDDPTLGPPGAAGVPLSPGHSLAVDATLWRYGLPFWLEASDDPATGRLAVAADTGSAIVGPVRGDLYLGTGEAAGVTAGNLRAQTGFVVLLPRSSAPTAP